MTLYVLEIPRVKIKGWATDDISKYKSFRSRWMTRPDNRDEFTNLDFITFSSYDEICHHITSRKYLMNNEITSMDQNHIVFSLRITGIKKTPLNIYNTVNDQWDDVFSCKSYLTQEDCDDHELRYNISCHVDESSDMIIYKSEEEAMVAYFCMSDKNPAKIELGRLLVEKNENYITVNGIDIRNL